MKFPDWSKTQLLFEGIQKVIEIENNGYILVEAHGWTGREGIYLNDYLIADGGDQNNSDLDHIFIPVKRGDVLKCKQRTSYNSKATIYFIPFK